MKNSDNQTASFQTGFILLAGDDAILRERARADLLADVRSRHPDVEIERYDPANGDFATFCESVITPSLLSPMRIFLAPEVHLLDEKDLALLAGLFDYELPDAYVVMESDRLAGKKTREAAPSKRYLSWLDSLQEHVRQSPDRFLIREFAKPPEYKMAEWVEAQTPLLFKRRISKSNAEYLIDLAGADSSALFSELQKIDLFLQEKAPIDKAVIDTVVGPTRLMTQFELAQALGKKDIARVLEIIQSIYSANVYLPLFIGAIFRQFWAMFRISEFAKVKPDVVRGFKASLKGYNRQLQEETGTAIGVAAGLFSEKQVKSVYPVLVKSGIVDQALSFDTKQYQTIFSMLKEYDVGLKTGKADDSKSGFELFCYRIVKGGLS